MITVLVGETNEAEDEEFKTPDQLRLLMRKHYTVGGLTDVLSVFGPVKEDVRKRIEISFWLKKSSANVYPFF